LPQLFLKDDIEGALMEFKYVRKEYVEKCEITRKTEVRYPLIYKTKAYRGQEKKTTGRSGKDSVMYITRMTVQDLINIAADQVLDYQLKMREYEGKKTIAYTVVGVWNKVFIDQVKVPSWHKRS
jgi:hypothetical protein